MNRTAAVKLLTIAFIFGLFSASCTRRLGYGVLLWTAGDPPIPSGTILPVYIRSNINRVWVVGIPDAFRNRETKINKFELPLAKLELAGSWSKAKRRASEFAPYALSYAETLQDGLPIRENPDNGARRIYRLRQGEIIKILSPEKGIPAIGGSGDPLPGEWFKVLTESGTVGYCFSYRLLMFEYEGGDLASAPRGEMEEDLELERLLSKNWVAETYGTMVNSQRFDLEELSENWGFDPGLDTGIARISSKEVERSFSYTAIRSTGTRSWRFDGSSLQMNLRSDSTLAVQFTETSGLLRTVLFVSLQSSLDDFVIQETARREELFNFVHNGGPAYDSHNYGTITFSEGSRFSWIGYDLLVPQVIPASAIGNGRVDMRLFLSDSLSGRYTGAFTLRFNSAGSSRVEVDFLYTLDNEGLRLEYVPDTGRDGNVVSRRSSSPMVLFFFRDQSQPLIMPESFLFNLEPGEYDALPHDGFEFNYYDSDDNQTGSFTPGWNDWAY